jgi:hypothetical protein
VLWVHYHQPVPFTRDSFASYVASKHLSVRAGSVCLLIVEPSAGTVVSTLFATRRAAVVVAAMMQRSLTRPWKPLSITLWNPLWQPQRPRTIALVYRSGREGSPSLVRYCFLFQRWGKECSSVTAFDNVNEGNEGIFANRYELDLNLAKLIGSHGMGRSESSLAPGH